MNPGNRWRVVLFTCFLIGAFLLVAFGNEREELNQRFPPPRAVGDSFPGAGRKIHTSYGWGALLYDFEDQMLGEEPSCGNLAVYESNGYVDVGTLGDSQGKVARVVRETGTDTVQLRDEVSTGGSTPMRGAISFKFLKSNYAGFHFIINDLSTYLLQLNFWDDIEYYSTLSGTHDIQSYSAGQWYEVTVIFDINRGWMVTINGTTYGENYSFDFYDSSPEALTAITWMSFYSDGTPGIFHVDDIDYDFPDDDTSNNGGWSPTSVISDGAYGVSIWPKAATNDAGDIYVVWDESGIKTRVWNATSMAWDSSITLIDDSGAIYPALAIDPSKNAHFVWQQNHHIYYRRWNASTKGWEGSTQVSVDPSCTNPEIAADGLGHIHVTWTQGTIKYRRWDGTTGTWGGVLSVGGSTSDDESDVTADDWGNVHIVWHASNNIYYRNWLVSGGWSGATTLRTGSSSWPAAWADPNGYMHLAWVENGDVYYMYWNASTTGWSTPALISAESPGSASHPRISADGNERVHVVWYIPNGANDTVYYSRRTGFGGWWSLDKILSSESEASSVAPWVTVDPGGDAHVFWHDYSDLGGCGTDADIFYRRWTKPNTPPVASDCIISTPVITSDDLELTYTYSDGDGDPETGTEVRWYREGVLQPTFNDRLQVPAAFTNRSEQWHASVRPYDGQDFGTLETSPAVIVSNTPPVASNLAVSSPATTVTTLELSYAYFDADGDDEAGTVIRWYRNAEHLTIFDGWEMIPGDWTNKSEQWHASVEPSDGQEFGNFETTCSVVIGNSPPEVETVTIQEPVQAGDPLVASCIFLDLDGDTNQSALRWYKDGVEQETFNDWTIIPAGWTNKTQEWNLTVIPFDGEATGAAESAVVLIGNTPPIAKDITLATPVTTETPLELTYTYLDIDEDPEAGTQIRWYQGGALQPSFNDLLEVPAAFTNRSDQWYATVRPRDGLDFGDLESSPVATITNTAPIASDLTLTSPATTTTALELTYNYFDADGDEEVETEIHWHRDSVHLPAFDGLTIIPACWTNKSEQWHAIVIPYDGIHYGLLSETPLTMVGNDAPSVWYVNLTRERDDSPPSPPVTALTTDNLVLAYTYWDLDGDPADSPEIRWFKDGIHQPAYDGCTVLPTAASTRGEVWNVTVQAYDGFSFGLLNASQSVTIVNSYPESRAVSIHPDPPAPPGKGSATNTSANLVLSYTYWDADGDPEFSLDIRWFRDEVHLPVLDDLHVIPAGFTNQSDTWHVEVRGYDGISAGLWNGSAGTQIQNSPPVLITLSICAEHPYAGAQLDLQWTGWDVDGESTSLRVEWFVDGLIRPEFVNSTRVLTGITQVGENWTARASLWDGTIWGPAENVSWIILTNPKPNLVHWVQNGSTNREIQPESPPAGGPHGIAEGGYYVINCGAATGELLVGWTISDLAGSSGSNASYRLIRNGTLVQEGAWSLRENVTLLFLPTVPGTYEFACLVWDGLGENNTDTLVIRVTSPALEITGPADLSYVVGTHPSPSLSWIINDICAGNGTYTITVNGTRVKNGTWTSGTTINLTWSDLQPLLQGRRPTGGTRETERVSEIDLIVLFRATNIYGKTGADEVYITVVVSESLLPDISSFPFWPIVLCFAFLGYRIKNKFKPRGKGY